jgi:Uma2 family endonuclease
MALPEPVPAMSPEEYLEWEKEQPVKHEYVAGQVFAMAGASDPHVTVTMNIATLLRAFVRGGPCRMYAADMKVRIATDEVFYYPDVLVTCDERDRANVHFKEHPRLIVEVLSPSTAAFDRGLKFAHYRTLPSMEEFVLIDSERRSVECFRKGPDDRWVLYPFGPGEQVELASLGFRCSMDAVYEDVELG